MDKFLKILVGFLGLLLAAGPAWGQLDNRAFISQLPGKQEYSIYYVKSNTQSPEQHRSIDSLNKQTDELKRRFPDRFSNDSLSTSRRPRAGELRLSIHAFTFFKDNEYFNEINEGYTLFGTQLNPQLVYYPIKELRLEAGVFLWKDFGNPVLQQVRPTFRATWTRGNNEFIFGNIRPHLHHDYIEPLYDFESVMLRPLEEGLQFRRQSRRLFLDAWVNWLRQQYVGSTYQEEIAGGLSSSFRLTGDDSPVQLNLPFQFTARHFGGQIDVVRLPVRTYFNYASGLVARRQIGRGALQAVRLNAYGLLFADNSSIFALPFQRGHALYLNGTLETRYGDLMLSYWRGSNYYSPLGGPYYQSVASIYGTPGFTDPERRLLLVRLLRDFRVSDAAAVMVRVEPVYDFNKKLLDFSFGVYLNFRQEWLLGNVGRRVRVGQ